MNNYVLIATKIQLSTIFNSLRRSGSGLAHRLYQITTTIHNNTILWIIHAAIAPLNSLSFAIVYSLFVIIEHFHKEPQPDEARHNERDHFYTVT